MRRCVRIVGSGPIEVVEAQRRAPEVECGRPRLNRSQTDLEPALVEYRIVRQAVPIQVPHTYERPGMREPPAVEERLYRQRAKRSTDERVFTRAQIIDRAEAATTSIGQDMQFEVRRRRGPGRDDDIPKPLTLHRCTQPP